VHCEKRSTAVVGCVRASHIRGAGQTCPAGECPMSSGYWGKGVSARTCQKSTQLTQNGRGRFSRNNLRSLPSLFRNASRTRYASRSGNRNGSHFLDAPFATCRRCLPNPAGISTRRTRSASTIFNRSVRLTDHIARRPCERCGRSQGRLLSRRPLRNSEGRDRTLQRPLYP
jgi:hypothetical protein